MVEAQAFTCPSGCQSPAYAPAFLKDRHLETRILEQHSACDASHPGTNNGHANRFLHISHEWQLFSVAHTARVLASGGSPDPAGLIICCPQLPEQVLEARPIGSEIIKAKSGPRIGGEHTPAIFYRVDKQIDIIPILQHRRNGHVAYLDITICQSPRERLRLEPCSFGAEIGRCHVKYRCI